MTTLKAIYKILLKAILLIGIIGFIGGLVYSISEIKYEHELPLSMPTGILVNSENEVFISLEFYGVVQVYNSNGNYLRNWKVPNSGGSFRMQLINDQIHIATARKNLLIVYDKFGNVITQGKSKIAYDEFTETKKFTNPKTKNTYQLTGGLLPNVKIENEESSIILIQSPLINWLLVFPFPSMIFIVFGMFGLFIINKEKYNRKLNQLTNKY